MKPKKRTILAWVICIPLVALEIYGFVHAKKLDTQSLIVTLAVFCLVFGIFIFLQKRGGEKVEKDERTIRIENRALSYSWIISFLSVSAFGYLEYIEVLRLSASQVLFYILMIMTLSSFAARIILKRKGDVD
jgi:uncharacterized membrane protein YfcA